MSLASWLIIGTLLVIAEMATGTFYLLAIGLAFIYPALATWLDAGMTAQLASAAIGIVVHVLIVNSLRKRNADQAPQNASLDAGQRVQILGWNSDGSARVMYRGAEWQADKADAAMPDAEHAIIQSIQGNRLIIITASTR